MDVFDALLSYHLQMDRLTPHYAALSDKIWVKALLDALRRSETLQTWSEMSVDSDACIAAISAFSGFRGADKLEVRDKLDTLASRVRSRLGVKYLASPPGISWRLQNGSVKLWLCSASDPHLPVAFTA